MKLSRLWVVLVTILILSISKSHADEGMFYPFQVPYNDIHQKFPETSLGPETLTHIAHSVVKVSIGEGGGSGSFISPDGLVFTNHHVVYNCVQDLRSQGKISAEKTSFASDSFYAPSYVEELPCETYQLHITQEVSDVTPEVVSLLSESTTPKKAEEALENISKKLISRCEGIPADLSPEDFTTAQDTLTVICKLNPLDSIQKYFLEKITVIRDVRLVYAPSHDTAFLGQDALNFQYPRHAVDAGLLRAYGNTQRQLPDPTCLDCPSYGTTEDVFDPITGDRETRFKAAETNRPLDTLTHYLLPAITADVQDGDFVMAVGYPGGTDRLRSHYATEFDLTYTFPFKIAYLSAKVQTVQNRIDELKTTADPALIQERESLRSLRASLMNSIQVYQGLIEGIQKLGLLQKRKERDAQLREALTTLNPPPSTQSVLEDIEKTYQRLGETAPMTLWLEKIEDNGALKAPATLVDLVKRLDADEDVPEEEWATFIDATQLRATDTAMSINILAAAIDMQARDARHHIPLIQRWITEIAGHEKLNPLELATNLIRFSLKGSGIFISPDLRETLLDLSIEELKTYPDPLVVMALELQEDLEQAQKIEDQLYATLLIQNTHYAEALKQGLGIEMPYYDANFSMRLTYGRVAGYQKGTPDAPIPVPFHTSFATFSTETLEGTPLTRLFSETENQYATQAAQVFGAQPVNFVSTLDITGGNSGSPVLNKDLKVVGAVFDGNWDSMPSDFAYDDVTSRAVSVSLPFFIQYMTADVAGDLTVPENKTKPNRITLELQAATRGKSVFAEEPPRFLLPRDPIHHKKKRKHK